MAGFILTDKGLVTYDGKEVAIPSYDPECDPRDVNHTCKLCWFQGMGCLRDGFVACGLIDPLSFADYDHRSLGAHFIEAKSLYSRKLLKYELGNEGEELDR